MARFKTDVLDRALGKAFQGREKRRADLLARVMSAIAGLSRDVPFERAFVFGSIIRPGGFFNRSDIDIGFYGLRDEDVIRATAFLSSRIGIDVDVIQMEGHRLEGRIKEGVEWKRRG